MAAAAASFFSQSVGTIHVCGCANSSGFCFGKSSSRSISNGFPTDVRLLGKRICSSSHCKLHVVRESNSCALMMDRVSSSSDSSIDNNGKRSIESALILIRHGESLGNEKNLFTGCVDVTLTKKGIEEALQAGIRICNIPIDVIYTSTLIRAQMTAMLAMTQHRHKKVPIIMHNENEQANLWNQIYSKETKKQSIPVTPAWQLNERMYGELQGLNKQETAERYGKELVHGWRRSYDIPPPNGESLEMCSKRAVAYLENILNLSFNPEST